MTTTISRRAGGVISYSYDDFPVPAGRLDLRGDNSPPLPATTVLLEHPRLRPPELAGYGTVAGEPALRAAMAQLFAMTADSVVITAGASEALFLALTCVADHGQRVHLPRPAFPGYEQLAHITGLRPIPYAVPGALPLPGPGEPLLVCTPHNPTGVLIAPQPRRSAGWTIWDLSHMPPIGDSPADFGRGLGSHDITVFSLSKALRLPGARVGCLVSRDRDLTAAVIATKTHLSMSTSRLAQDLAARVLRHPGALEDVANRTRAYAGHRARMLDAVATSTCLQAWPALDGTHVFVRPTDGRDGWRILADAGVVGLPGVVFNGTSDAVRLCIAQPPDVVDRAVRIVGAL
jgi:aspartate/methionine/tyrosine aminotransferase